MVDLEVTLRLECPFSYAPEDRRNLQSHLTFLNLGSYNSAKNDQNL